MKRRAVFFGEVKTEDRKYEEVRHKRMELLEKRRSPSWSWSPAEHERCGSSRQRTGLPICLVYRIHCKIVGTGPKKFSTWPEQYHRRAENGMHNLVRRERQADRSARPWSARHNEGSIYDASSTLLTSRCCKTLTSNKRLRRICRAWARHFDVRRRGERFQSGEPERTHYSSPCNRG